MELENQVTEKENENAGNVDEKRKYRMPTLARVGDLVQKFHVQFFFKPKGEDIYTRVEKATENTIATNPETEERDFIVDESPTTILKSYKPSIAETFTMYKGNADFDKIWQLFYNLKTGAEAIFDFLVVFYFDEALLEGKRVFNAWKCDMLTTVDNMTPTDNSVTVNFNVAGTVMQGTVDISSGQPVFTETDKNAVDEEKEKDGDEKDANGEDGEKADDAEDGQHQQQQQPPAAPEKVRVTFMDYSAGDDEAVELAQVEIEKGRTLADAIGAAVGELDDVSCKEDGDFGHWSETEDGDDFGNDTAINEAKTLYAVAQE